MTEPLTLAEFPPVSTAQWEDAIRKDLKGKDPGRKLFYRAEDLQGLDYLDAPPGQFPYTRGTRDNNSWEIREIVRLAPGQALPTDRGLVHFEAGDRAAEVVEALIATPAAQPASVDYEPLADFDRAVELAKRSQAVPGFRPITIGAHRFAEAGGNPVNELGGALLAGVEIMTQLIARDLSPADAAASLAFSFAIGSSYFAEIAKLRAARTLWANVVESFQPAGPRSAKMTIYARTSHWTKTIYDPHVNLLRATTEAMAAIIGGADSLDVEPFDATYREPGEFSRRLARNTHLILKHEALLDRTADPAGGSYYIEALTDSIAQCAWKMLQQIEAGGYASCSEAHTPPRAIIGANRYPNLAERMLPEIARPDPAPRAAAAFEEIRLRTERHAARTGHTPRFLLLESGDPKMRQARSTFATNFFGSAGFDIGISGALTGDPDVVVLCSSDAEYPTLAPRIIQQLRDAGKSTPVIVAGNPAGAIAGVADYVNLRSDQLQVLRAWQQRLGVES